MWAIEMEKKILFIYNQACLQNDESEIHITFVVFSFSLLCFTYARVREIERSETSERK